ncbi:hypothetical protein BURKHO8Y_10437 [Burkholderia sp. 8Y]|nr:hypothetical protein BURKHO8Y_10437 [Burkholderia sp. 8Y]
MARVRARGPIAHAGPRAGSRCQADTVAAAFRAAVADSRAVVVAAASVEAAAVAVVARRRL